MAETTSPSLLLRIRDPNNQLAWNEFEELYSGIIRAYCRQRRLQPHDEDDLVQEVMNTICKSIRKFDYDPAKGRFRAWLGTITANRINNHLARNNGRSNVATGAGLDVEGKNGNWADPDSSWVEIFSERVFQSACKRVRPDVTPTTWECFASTWIGNEEASDVAVRLGIPVHSVYVNKSRVLKRLEQQIRMLAEDIPVAENVNDG